MRVAYADPPYVGQARLYKRENPGACEVNHRVLIATLCDGYDAWALSASAPSLRVLLPMCPRTVRVMCWIKPFAFFKPNVRVGYAWEPVIVQLPKGRRVPLTRDWISASSGGQKRTNVGAVARGEVVPGAKPAAFCRWLFDVLGLTPNDEFHDLFPGSGAVTRAWEAWRTAARPHQLRLDGEAA
jgi:hypothetical protein